MSLNLGRHNSSQFLCIIKCIDIISTRADPKNLQVWVGKDTSLINDITCDTLNEIKSIGSNIGANAKLQSFVNQAV